jgi:hypothetical protein
MGIKFTLNLVGGGSVLVGTEVPNTSTGEFFGFVSTDAFTSVFYDGGTQPGSAETHTLDNLQFAAVPEPATFGLMGLAMAGLSAAAYRKSRRRV